MSVLDKVKELKDTMTDTSLTLDEKQAYVDALTLDDMRDIFKEMMTAWVSKDQ